MMAVPETPRRAAPQGDTRSGPGTGQPPATFRGTDRADARKDRRKEPQPALWYVTAYELARAVRSDDGRGAVLARRHAERVVVPLDDHQSCPDPELFELMRLTALRWCGRTDPHLRDRLTGPLLSLTEAVQALARRPQPQVLPGLLKGVPLDDR